MRGPAVLLGALCLVLAGGCGGGGGGKKLTHEDFVKQANAICADYNDRIGALTTPTSFDAIASYAKDVRAIAQQDVAKFKKLNPPDADRANWQTFGKQGDAVITASHDLESAAKKKDGAAIRRLLAEGRQRAAESKRVATAMGTAECAKT